MEVKNLLMSTMGQVEEWLKSSYHYSCIYLIIIFEWLTHDWSILGFMKDLKNSA